jgi:hypothetical protein
VVVMLLLLLLLLVLVLVLVVVRVQVLVQVRVLLPVVPLAVMSAPTHPPHYRLQKAGLQTGFRPCCYA